MKMLLIILLSTLLFATATRTNIQSFTQSDGSSFLGRLQGDAFLHWIETKDGSILLFNKKTENFEYATIKNGDLTLSGNIYNTSKLRSLHVNTISKDNLQELWKQRHP
ncbi:MAG: hypothetical protein U9R50_10855 [Campylobacterota bacterium]|nr:hypothetical protein [Campylobacterota bacterium]